MGSLVRFMFRLAVLGLAAVGAKSLYERFAPKAAEMRGPATDVAGSAKEAAQDVANHARTAAAEVVDDARTRADAVRAQAAAAAEQVRHNDDDDEPATKPAPMSAPV